MSELKLEALVLKRTDSGESDRRLTVLTRDRGRMDVVAKGARKPGSRLAGISEPLSLVSLLVATGKRQTYITQAQPIRSYKGFRADLDRLLMALAFAELVSALAHHDLVNEELFDLADACLLAIESNEDPLSALIWAELKLLEVEGLAPSWDVCCISGVKLRENPAWVSPSSGGYVRAANTEDIRDRFLAPGEVLIGLARTAELEKPPARLKRATECLAVLSRVWEQHAHAKLPANENLHRHLASEKQTNGGDALTLPDPFDEG